MPLTFNFGGSLASKRTPCGLPPASRSGRDALEKAGGAELIARCDRLLNPAIAHRLYPVKQAGTGGIVLENGVSLPGWNIPRVMNPARELAAIVCTVGPALEREVARLFRAGEALKAVQLDQLGNEALESVIDKALELIALIAEESGYRTSPPITPGSGTMPLSLQRTVWELARADEIGVTLTPTAMMSPLKSASVVVALGPDLPATAEAGLCAGCNLADSCRYKQARNPSVTVALRLGPIQTP